MSFATRDLSVHLVPGVEGPPLVACNACNTTAGGGQPKPDCAPPSQCQDPSQEPDQIAMELGALDLALLRSQLRKTLYDLQ